MAKLNVVVPATNVIVDGVEYRQVEREAQAGDIVRYDKDGYGFLPKGAFYRAYVDEDGDVVIDDEDGDPMLVDEDYTVFEPVSKTEDYVTVDDQLYRKEKRAASVGEKVLVVESFCYGKEGDIATVKSSNRVGKDVVTDKHRLMNDYRYVVLVPVTTARLKVGDYAKIINTGEIGGSAIDDSVKLGDVFEIIADDMSSTPFHVKRVQDGLTHWFKEKRLVRATDEEVATAQTAAKAALDPRNQFAKGDKVRLIAKGDRLNGYEVGKVYTVVEPLSEADRVKINGGTIPQGYAKAAELVKVTEEEIAQEALTAKWAAIGRKVGEYKTGDIVEVTDASNLAGNASRKIVNGSVVELGEIDSNDGAFRLRAPGVELGNWARPDEFKLVTPVEQRFDRVG